MTVSSNTPNIAIAITQASTFLTRRMAIFVRLIDLSRVYQPLFLVTLLLSMTDPPFLLSTVAILLL